MTYPGLNAETCKVTQISRVDLVGAAHLNSHVVVNPCHTAHSDSADGDEVDRPYGARIK